MPSSDTSKVGGADVRVYMTPEEKEQVAEYAEERGLTLSAAGRALIKQQLRYIAYRDYKMKGGKPRKKKPDNGGGSSRKRDHPRWDPTPKERELVEQARGRSYDEAYKIGEELGMSKGEVDLALHRAKKEEGS